MKIKFVNEIPQWIISSDIAAYHPATKTIWIRNNLGWKTIPTLIHELTHWFIHKFLGNSEKLHNKLDGKNLKLTITDRRYVFGLPCIVYRVTTTAFGKLKYTACYLPFLIDC